MTCRTLAVAGLLLAVTLPVVSHAQTTTSRFYAGASANLLSNTPFNSGPAPRLVGPSLTAGFQLTPHVALQAGISYHWQKEGFSRTDSIYAADGGPLVIGTYTSEHRFKYFIMPVLLRYTFAPSAERFHVDALGGVTLLYSSRHSSYTNTPTNLPPDSYKSSYFDANLTLGPAVRYTVAPHMELTASSLVSAVLGRSYYRFSDRFFLNTSIGVNYTFG
jgi:hypothetical protein